MNDTHNIQHALADLELKHLRLVSTVARCGTLTQAGQELHLTQSALSHQLRDLEERIGVPLFQRLKRRMVITPAGERLLRAAHNVHRELTATLGELQEMINGHVGSIRLATGCYTAYYWLPPLLKKFAVKYPGIDINVVVEATRRPLEALRNGTLDLAIMSLSDTSFDGRFEYCPLFEDEMVAVLPSDHPLAEKQYLTPSDFKDQHLITYDANEDDLSIFQEFLFPAGVTPRKTSRVQLSEAILAMVKAGLGITVLVRWTAIPDLSNGSLVAVQLGKKGLHRHWYAVRSRQFRCVPQIDEFIEMIAKKSRPSLLEHA